VITTVENERIREGEGLANRQAYSWHRTSSRCPESK